MARRWPLGLTVLALLVVLVWTLSAFAQETTVRGNATVLLFDTTGAVIQKGNVTITGPTGSKTEQTDESGSVTFSLLSPGFYSFKAEKQGFKSAELRQAEVFTGKTSTFRITMQPGAVSEVLEVTATAVTVDTTSTSVASNLNDEFYSRVPEQRGVTGIFYNSVGVSTGLGTGAQNPSISGGSGLENIYVADGVNMTDGAFGGIGVYSRVYQSLGTGINLSFVKEVQVKTGGFEAQYGGATGGIVQIVTKSGGNEYHGAVSGFFGPQELEAVRKQSDPLRFGQLGEMLHQGGFDFSGEIGGYVPGFRDKLFFFGNFNPSWNRYYDQYTQLHGLNYPVKGLYGTPVTLPTITYNYAGKVTYKLSDKHQLEGDVFGDPSRTPVGPWASLNINNNTGQSKLGYGDRNVAVRYNGTLSPTWLFNMAVSWKNNYLNETPLFPHQYLITNQASRGVQLIDQFGTASGPLLTDAEADPGWPTPPTVQTGIFNFQGRGYFENTRGDTYALSADTQKVIHYAGEHTFSIGFRGEKSIYDGVRGRSGNLFPIPGDLASASGCDGVDTSSCPPGMTDITGLPLDATFRLRLRSGNGTIFGYAMPNGTTVPCDPTKPVPPDAVAAGAGACSAKSTSYPLMFIPGLGWKRVRMQQDRGEFSPRDFRTNGKYFASYVSDTWTPIKYITLNLGLRWEQQYMRGNNAGYTFTDNWSPRVGATVDPWGDRKTKVYTNFARYNYAIPLDMAIRSLSAELDLIGQYWKPTSSAAGCAAFFAAVPAGFPLPPCGTSAVNGVVVTNPDGTLVAPTLDSAHVATGGSIGSSAEPIAHGTHMQMMDEWVVGFERDMGRGVIFSARYIDRRLKRIVEDMAGLSPEAYNAGLGQQYFIANPTKSQDLFTNPIQIAFAPTFAPDGSIANVPAACMGYNGTSFDPTNPFPFNGTVIDTFGNPIAPGAVCVVPKFTAAGVHNYKNGAGPGDTVPDGKPDGFVNPVRNYQAVEVEVNKSFSQGWQLRTNYRYAKLRGNYEGAFRNDNGQSDPNISSLFDFTEGNFGLLGSQFAVGYLNSDARHTVNSLFSYTFDKSKLKGLTIGPGIRVQSGLPMNDLKAHPAYLNAGEIPVGGRGALGRSPLIANIDLHTDYAIKLTEKSRLHFGADLFNLVNMKRNLTIDQFEDRQFGVPNPDFQVPGNNTFTPASPILGWQRPFNARLMARWEF